MRYYRDLVEMPCFSSQDLTSLIGSYDSARAILHRYMKAGLIERVKHNLYAVISLETGQPIANRFAIGTRAAEGAYISHHSALEYHGFANCFMSRAFPEMSEMISRNRHGNFPALVDLRTGYVCLMSAFLIR